MTPSNNSSSRCGEKKTGFLHVLFFSWLNGILKLGSQRPLTQDDLYPLSDENKAEELVKRLEYTWTQEVNIAHSQGKQPKLWRAMFRVLPVRRYLYLLAIKIPEMVVQFSLVVLLWLYFKFLQGESHMDKRYPPIIVLGIGVCSFNKVFCYHHGDQFSLTMGMQIKIAAMGMVYKKILSTTCSSLKGATSGFIMNLLSNDAQNVEKAVMGGVLVTYALIAFPVAMALLWALVGWQSLSGTILLILYLIYEILILSQYQKLKYKQTEATDDRLATVQDIISGIRAVKMYALEWKFSDVVKSLRRKEINLLRLQSIISTLPDSLFLTLTPIATLVSMTTLLYSDVHINVVDIFTIVSLYSIITYEIAISCNLDLLTAINGFISIKRLEKFLIISNHTQQNTIPNQKCDSATENDTPSKTGISDSLQTFFKRKMEKKRSSKHFKSTEYSFLHNSDDVTDVSSDDNHDLQPHVTMKQVSAGWLEDEHQCTLRDISLNTQPNQLLMVTGPVGSGKSTLLMAILREISIKSGKMSTQGKIAYVSQHPWIFTGTVRENILFGQEFEFERYQRVIDVCDLHEDLSHFPRGDLSMIGQRGVSLSGGQRVRVSLARAVYSDADIYLLDDPLSALDVKVGQYVLDECICKELSNRIRILVTHQIQHLHRADNIMILKEGRLATQGSHKQLKDEGSIGDLSHDYSKSSTMEGNVENDVKENCKSAVNTGKDMAEEDEDKHVGTVTWHVYWEYFKAALPSVLIVCFAFFYLAVQVNVIAPNWWLSRIAKLPHHQQKNATSLGILAILAVTAFALCLTKECLLYNILISASKNLHHKMTLAVLKSPVLFFDTNPLGRIMNRFSNDIGGMDNFLPNDFVLAASLCTNAVGVVVLTLITNIWFILVVIPLALLFYCICYYYMKTARDLKRIEAMQCSPIFAHVAETTAGLEVIRTTHMQETFLKTMFRYQDDHTRAFYLVMSTARWFGLYNDLLCAIFVSSVAVVSLSTSEDKALSAMILTLSISLLSSAQFGVKKMARVESLMTSVERVIAYTKLPSEPGYNRHVLPPEDWPTKGALSLRNVSLIYLESGPRVLKEISLDVHSAEKVGIAGRTGAGKSSLVASLFRMPDPEGHVLIDGVDLGTIHLQAARRSMAVITQDPVLFLGSLRKNLDPFDCLPDLQMWTALEEVQLKDKVLSLDDQLEYSIGEGGSGLSVGERQLLCLARALLQRCKILVLDEATANIDFQTDQLIQQTIRNKFTKCTVLTVAHRLNTIIDYDKVVVLDDGQIVEHDNPRVLAERKNGTFAKLLHKGSSEAGGPQF